MNWLATVLAILSLWLVHGAAVAQNTKNSEALGEAQARCEQKLGNGAVAEEELDFGETTYVCDCASPYRWNEGNTQCVEQTSGKSSDSKQPNSAAKASAHACDRLAANPSDPERRSPGLSMKDIDTTAAIAACSSAVAAKPDEARLHYQLGRALHADSQMTAAINAYRIAEKMDYAAAMHNLAGVYQSGTGVPKDVKTAFRFDLKAANKGLAISMTEVGRRYHFGIGVPRDYKEALRWFRKGAGDGDAPSMMMVGYAYAQGYGVARSNTEAIRWYRKASNNGNAAASSNLAIRYFKGFGVAEDRKEALRLWRIAAAKGHSAAMTAVGYYYGNGLIVAEDQQEAVRWFRKAAEAGESLAMYNLGAKYFAGAGVQRSNAEARRWIKAALKSNNQSLVQGLTDKNNSWSRAYHKITQQILRDSNLYKGPIDGKLGPATLSAIRRYKKEN